MEETQEQSQKAKVKWQKAKVRAVRLRRASSWAALRAGRSSGVDAGAHGRNIVGENKAKGKRQK
jgi:hypothetical protein